TWTGKALARYEGHSGPVNALAFTSDGKTIASGAGDSTVLLWEVYPEAESTGPKGLDAVMAWDDLDSQDIRQAYRAAGGLIAAGPRGVAAVRDGLKTSEEQQKQIRKWIAELDDYQFKVRDNARRQIIAAGLRAVPALRAEQARKLSTEAEQRLKLLFEDLASRG